MKYIIVETEIGDGLTKELPIIFPNDLSHCDVFEAIVKMSTPEMPISSTCVSAGFLNSLDMNPRCNDESVSLKIKSRNYIDDNLIKMHDYMHGIKTE